MSDKFTIEIDGRSCEASPGEMIIEVADREGIRIPRFCYHKKLSIAANCRMCLVEAEQGGRPFPKPLPACATPVGNGMKVQTRSPQAIEAQQGTMEFLLINHPLDCPICDQGGECELQDVAIGYGGDVSRYSEGKRVVKDEDLGPLIATEMTRCIHCTRCVRFGAEIAGIRELGVTGRGEQMRIGTYVAHTVAHELSGNVIDLCPVGALTSKPYRFTARAWELNQAEGIAPHDAVGSNVHLHIRRNQVLRVNPKDNEAVNETWISDRDRFSYEGLNGDDRLTSPMVKRDGAWHPVEWEDALIHVAERLKAVEPDQIGCLLSPSATLEEMYLAQKLVRGLGSNNIDHRLRQQDFRADAADPLLPWLGVPIAELDQQKALLLVGSDIRQEQPLLAHRIRQAALAGARVGLVNPYRMELTHPSIQLAGSPDVMLDDLGSVAKALGNDAFSKSEPGVVHQEMAEALNAAGGEGIILIGALAQAMPDYAQIKQVAYAIAKASGARVGFLPPGANGVGAHLAGALPHVSPGAKPADKAGIPVADMLDAPRKAYLLWGLEPDLDSGNPAQAMAALEQAGFVVACSAYLAPSLDAVADVMLPIGGFAETSGTLVNADGTWQRFQGAVAPPGEARPGWKILRVLGNLLDLDGFGYNDTAAVHDELAAVCNGVTPDNVPRGTIELKAQGGGDGLMRIGNVPIYAIDPMVRRARALQRSPLACPFGVYINASQSQALGVADGDEVEIKSGTASAMARVAIDDGVPDGCARIPAGVAGSEALGGQFAPVSINKA